MSTPPDPGLDAVISERRQLISLAYRLLGSLADAEDVVQETYARWYAMPRGRRQEIDSPGGWLTTVAGRICLDVLRSARVRRESYVGEWVPEPVPDSVEWLGGRAGGEQGDPAERVTLDESVSMAFLVVLESMTPAERVSFVLHDVFRYPFPEVAKIVGRSPAACRQLAVSARRRLDSARPGSAGNDQHAAVVRKFKAAWDAKDIDALVGLLDPDAVAASDGGGVVRALLEPLHGAEAIGGFLAMLIEGAPDLRPVERTVNGQAGLVLELGGATSAVMAFDVRDGRIRRMWSVRNPEKLRPWGPTLDAAQEQRRT
ncbi:RNA polymerase sigma factor SigJ [Streptomyces sp. VRA16 Mangrove soil]|uniref:RNA polymerase sigma factor SigJ n=1 Tax=Streptomyces sp. VRA16 Mangrove soil TaxID=2817434 RepID=UPI001A9F629E|nr:RNA polymerase sigma factor SigJ [Streptomyces sp. VRA16 Mangrove soil]MBO1334227.1 RNA polymerase sigma factor SigJ [Streptomyces sp. VRA16 Mangrove soil]